jgi:hypothetical protein
MTPTFNKNHFLIFITLFCLEVFIALYIHDRFIRPFIGDVLVVILIYTLIRTFLKIEPRPLAIGVLAFACLVEFSQYLKLATLLGLENVPVARVVLGSTFDPLDLFAYATGTAVIILAATFFQETRLSKSN